MATGGSESPDAMPIAPIFRRYQRQPATQAPPTQRLREVIRTLEEYHGDQVAIQKPQGITRIMFQNADGIVFDPTGLNIREVFETMSIHQVDVLGIAEHQLDTTKPEVRDVWHKTLKKSFSHSSSQFDSSAVHAPKYWKPGGTAVIASNYTSGRVMSRLGDSYGRWSSILLKGRSTKSVRFIAAYQVCENNNQGIDTASNQQHIMLRRNGRHERPRQAFIKDLTEQIKTWSNGGEEIILAGDFNETMNANGSKIADLACETGLLDLWSHRFPNQPEFPTYVRTNNPRRIDIVLVTPGVLPAIRSITYCPFHSHLKSDHRSIMMDWDTRTLFGNETNRLATMPTRGIRASSAKGNTDYILRVYKHLDHTKIFSKMERLMHEDSPRDDNAVEAIDEQLQRACITAETAATKYPSTWYSKKVVKARTRLQGLKRIQSGFRNQIDVTRAVIQWCNQRQVELTPPTTTQECNEMIEAAISQLKEECKKEKKNRELEQEDKIQELLEQSTEQKPRIQIIRSIRRAEMLKETFRMYRCSGATESAVTHIQIPSSWHIPELIESLALSDLEDPKTCTSWKTVTQPDEIEKCLQVRNRLHFGQAEKSPFTVPPLSEELDWSATTEKADDILEGNYDTSTMDKAMQLLLQRCKHVTESEEVPPELSMEEFTGKLRKWKESTSTSPSGRHLGHYKALVRRFEYQKNWPEGEQPPSVDEALEGAPMPWYELNSFRQAILGVHLGIVNYCIRNGYVLRRWKKVVNVMILKQPGDLRIHRLRVIHLYEADYNLMTGVKWRRLQKEREKDGSIHRGQWGGRKGRSANSLVLMEEMTYEISQLTRRPMINFDNDATSCYDRIVVRCASLVCRRYGQHRKLVAITAKTLQEATFKLKTAIGVSDIAYSHCAHYPIHGTGQGSGNSPMIWLFISSLLFECHEAQAHGAFFATPDGQEQVKFSMVGFVDDSTGRVNDFSSNDPGPIEQLIEKMQADAQLWNDLLYCTGGKLELSKCSYHLISFSFKADGTPRMDISQPPTTIKVQDAETLQEEQIQFKNIWNSHKTLGHHKSPQGRQQQQRETLEKRAMDISLMMATAPTTRAGAKIGYNTHYVSAIRYVLPQCFFSPSQLDTLQKQSMRRIKRKCGYNQHTSNAICYGPTESGGANFHSWEVLQGEGQIHLFLQTWRTKTDVSRILRIAVAWYQYQSGSGIPLFEEPGYPVKYVESRWLHSLRRFLSSIDGRIELDRSYIPSLQREGDIYLMDWAQECQAFNDDDLKCINYCRMYLDVTTLADITTADGNMIDVDAFHGIRSPFSSTIGFRVNQGRPSGGAWKRWKRLVGEFASLTTLRIAQPLGKWYFGGDRLRRKWPLYITPTAAYKWNYTNDNYEQHPRIRFRTYDATGVPSPEWKPNATSIPGYELHTQISTNKHAAANNVISESNTRPETFEDYKTMWPIWEQELCTNLTFVIALDEIIEVIIMNYNEGKKLISVSDGGLKNGTMTYGFILGLSSGDILIEGSGIATGEPSSHRAEAWGALAATVCMARILKFMEHTADWTILAYTDNAGLVTNLQNQQAYGPLVYASATSSPDWEIVHEIYEVGKALYPIQYEYHHVKGHQDQHTTFDELPVPAQFNVKADNLARQQYSNTPDPQVKSPLLPNSGAHLSIRGISVTGHYQRSIRKMASEPALRNYIKQRNGWNTMTENSIHWQTLSTLMKHHAHHQSQAVKLVHGLLATNHIRHRYNPATSDECTLCHLPNEDFDHILQCQHPSRQHWRMKTLTKLRLMNEQVGAEYSLTTVLHEALQRWFEGESMVDPANFPKEFQEVIDRQNAIGWSAFLRGFPAKQWIQVYDDNHDKKSRINGEQWISKVLLLIWKQMFEVWEIRNTETHGRDRESKDAAERPTLMAQIRAIHNNPEDYTLDDREFLNPNVELFLETATTGELRRWLSTHRDFFHESRIMQQSRALQGNTFLSQFGFGFRVNRQQHTRPNPPRRYLQTTLYSHRQPRPRRLMNLATIARLAIRSVTSFFRPQQPEHGPSGRHSPAPSR